MLMITKALDRVGIYYVMSTNISNAFEDKITGRQYVQLAIRADSKKEASEQFDILTNKVTGFFSEEMDYVYNV